MEKWTWTSEGGKRQGLNFINIQTNRENREVRSLWTDIVFINLKFFNKKEKVISLFFTFNFNSTDWKCFICTKRTSGNKILRKKMSTCISYALGYWKRILDDFRSLSQLLDFMGCESAE